MTSNATKTLHCKIHDIDYEVDEKLYSFMPFLNQCPECMKESDKKIAERQKEEAERDARLKEQYTREGWTYCGIEPRYFDATFENFEAKTETQKQAVKAVRALLDGKRESLILAGGNGVGKTHLAVCAVKEKGGKIVRMSRLTRQAINFPKDKGGDEGYIEELARQPLLVLEEVGRTKASEYELNLLSDIVDTRYARMKPTMMTTNRHFRKSCPKGGCPDCFQNYVTEDVISRFYDGDRVEVVAEDWRRTHDRRG